MFPPLDEERAAAVCRTMLQELTAGKLTLVQVTKLSEERAGNGLMLGALIARTAEGREIVLKAVSGLSRQLQVCDEERIPCDDAFASVGCSSDTGDSVIVPPIVTASSRDSALEANDEEIHELTRRIDSLTAPETAAERKLLTAKRAALCRQSLAKVYELYTFHCADGSIKTLNDICAEQGISLPPTGTGDCCAPKLLDYAYSHKLLPVSMCEVYYGKNTPHKQNGERYAPCDERCGILLPAMLGLEILYRDSNIIVVNKQSGVLSVPGKIEKDCIVNRVRRLFPDCIEQPAVHRLDMETSGLLVLAFTKEAHRALNRQFEEGSVEKRYVALVDGVLSARGIPAHGTNELYFRVDIEHRPHQIWDPVYGKKAITEWQIVRTETYYAPGEQRDVAGAGRAVTRVNFTPHTGRTHQLRLACADSHGFGVSIIGDTLYGNCSKGERLMLHAQELSFTHPATGERMRFFCKAPF